MIVMLLLCCCKCFVLMYSLISSDYRLSLPRHRECHFQLSPRSPSQSHGMPCQLENMYLLCNLSQNCPSLSCCILCILTVCNFPLVCLKQLTWVVVDGLAVAIPALRRHLDDLRGRRRRSRHIHPDKLDRYVLWNLSVSTLITFRRLFRGLTWTT